MRHPELWARLEGYSFDTGTGSAPFSVKLARAEGWSAAFTARVIGEYRRFLYLTQVSDRQVTPSQIVDAAWHMHLTFTRDYWDDLCLNVIGTPVHHQPCAGDEEMPRYRNQFAATKALYEAEFGHEPPVEIWGRDKTGRAALKTFARSEVGATGPAVYLLWAVGFAVVSLVLDETGDSTLRFILMAVAIFLLLKALLRWMKITRDIKRRRDAGDATVAVGGAWWFAYESDDPHFDVGSGDDGGGDSGGCGGCGD